MRRNNAPDGYLLDTPKVKATPEDFDFAIHLHFDTPKAYNLFSFVALWNPLRYYYEYREGEYRRFSDNLLSHDDFLSCDSPGADDHVRRLIHNDPQRHPPLFTLFHSLAEPLLPPGLGDRKLFYVGINWERLRGEKSRNQELLDMMDKSGRLRIYGPRRFLGVNVWRGYKSYVGEIPFDGVSIVKEIASAGISLVLSSSAHKESGLMSNRLFESLAAGAVIICDENAFARKHFGDTLLYVNTNEPPDVTHQQIREHLRWIDNNPEEALDLARRAPDIFRAWALPWTVVWRKSTTVLRSARPPWPNPMRWPETRISPLPPVAVAGKHLATAHQTARHPRYPRSFSV